MSSEIEGLVDKEKGVVIVCGLGETYVMEGNQKRILPSRSSVFFFSLKNLSQFNDCGS